MITIQKEKRFKTMSNTSKCIQFNIIASLRESIRYGIDLNQMSHRYVRGVLQNDGNDRLDFSKFKMVGILLNVVHGQVKKKKKLTKT